ncbi:PAS domain S-box protein [Methanosarcina vacuolata]|uniref:Sensory transduction histidine kinase n=1 Tax=Methanosarcina vacuolata Z-761 TaxID=1434123 RepID=A0A0E3Q434_9EURY|nr:PAS domain S-box protein [Methanosarcina vacuolata]AKB43438.1 sensory transduction histidine kinase [Methanosarcina vacuolata Z-761]
MKPKTEKLLANNPNPVLSVDKDGTVLYSNEASEPLLQEWGTKIGEKLPSSIEDLVLKTVFRNIPETKEVRVGKRVYLINFYPFPEEGCVNVYGFDISNRAGLEEKLWECEEKYRSIVETANEGVWITDTEAVTTFVNQKMAEMIGYTTEEMIGKSAFDFIYKDDMENLLIRIKSLQTGSKEKGYEMKFCRKDGGIVWSFVSSTPLLDAEGKHIGNMNMHSDITQRKKAEEELKRTNEKLEKWNQETINERQRLYNVLDTLPAMIILLTSDYHIAFANRRFRKRFGDPGGRHCYEYYFGFTQPCEFCESHKVLETGQPHHWEVSGPDGSFYDAYNLPFTDVDGSPMILEMDIDVTEQKKAEERLQESEERYRNIVETANEGISIIDAEERITFVNKQIEDMFGYSSEELVGRPMWNFLSDESKVTIKHTLKKGWENVNESLEIQFMRKDGSVIWTHTNSKSIFDKDGKFLGTLNLHTDITKRKEVEEALKNFEIARKKEIHHRIKNNLQVISSLLDLQAEKFRNRKNINESEVLEAFRESQDRVISMALIHEELYRGEELDKLNFSLYIKELADALFSTYRLGNFDVSLSMDLEENILLDMDTAVPLGIIVNELVSNSLKYAFLNRDKGEIQIKFHKDNNRENRSNIEESKSEEYKTTSFILTISDNGVGISEDLDIKELDSLGLQLVIFLVDQLDGKLELKKGNGTEFIIRFTVVEKNNHQHQRHT